MPSEATDTRVTEPVASSNRKMSRTPLVSSDTMWELADWNATQFPSADITGVSTPQSGRGLSHVVRPGGADSAGNGCATTPTFAIAPDATRRTADTIARDRCGLLLRSVIDPPLDARSVPAQSRRPYPQTLRAPELAESSYSGFTKPPNDTAGVHGPASFRQSTSILRSTPSNTKGVT